MWTVSTDAVALARSFLFSPYQIIKPIQKTVQSFMNLQNLKEWMFKHKILSIFIFLLLTGFIGGIVNPPPKNNISQKAEESIVAKEVKAIYDIPNLINKNKKEIIKILGTPLTDLDDTIDYEKDGYKLLITFDKKEYKVIDFFLSKSGTVTIDQKEELIKVANLTPQNKDYVFNMVKVIGSSDKYTGLVIKSKNRIIKEWDELLDLSKQAGVIYKDEKMIGGTEAYHIYVDKNWYLLKVDVKKNLVNKFSILKDQITGYANIKFYDSNSGELVAEYGVISGVEIYK